MLDRIKLKPGRILYNSIFDSFQIDVIMYACIDEVNTEDKFVCGLVEGNIHSLVYKHCKDRDIGFISHFEPAKDTGKEIEVGIMLYSRDIKELLEVIEEVNNENGTLFNLDLSSSMLEITNSEELIMLEVKEVECLTADIVINTFKSTQKCYDTIATFYTDYCAFKVLNKLS